MTFLLPAKNLVLIVSEARCDPSDFMEIADRIRAEAADIRVQVLQPTTLHRVARGTWDHPTLCVSLTSFPELEIKRGKLMITRALSKLQQSEIMRIGKIPTPHMEAYRFGMVFDESIWGSHVVLKPESLALTSKGDGLEIVAAKDISGRQEEDFPPGHFARTHKMLVQKFIDTGPRAILFRALTFMGEVLYINKITTKVQKQGRDIPANFHSKSPDLLKEFDDYPHIHAFARKIAAAFPQAPLLGCDILEEHETGQLYGLEVNAGGNVWHFSSNFLADDRKQHPELNAMRLNQYNAFDTAAKALINATRRLAV